MKFFHISDLHLGKRLEEYSLIDDQKYVLDKILTACETEKPDGIFIAGDVYDRANPSKEAMTLFDEFLYALHQKVKNVFVISGNHDSAEQLSFGSRIMTEGVHISPVYNGEIEKISLSDEYGKFNVYLLPFIKPIHVKRALNIEEIGSYTEAISLALERTSVNETERNVIVTHQFVTGAKRSDSEEISVGGSDNIDASVFSKFDYVALGHIHSSQTCMGATVKYCGTPLKYSLSEMNDEKSITVVEFYEKGNIKISEIPLKPLHDVREIKGTFSDLLQDTGILPKDDFIHIILTDEDEIPEAKSRLQTVYPNILRLDYDNERTRSRGKIDYGKGVENKSILELFEELYIYQNGCPLSDEQREIMSKLIKKSEGEEE